MRMAFVAFVLLVAPAILSAGVLTQMTTAFSYVGYPCNSHGIDTIRLANAPGDVPCDPNTDWYYYCAEVIRLNSSRINSFGGPGDVLPGNYYFTTIYIDVIGRTVELNETLSGVQDRNAPKHLWRPRVFAKLPTRSCFNWEYLEFNNPQSIIAFIPAGNNSTGQKGGFYLTNESIGFYTPADSMEAVAGGETDMPSVDVKSDAGIILKEIGTEPAYAAIRLYNLGAQGWGFKKSNSAFDMMFYKWTGWNQFQTVPMPFTTERGTYFPKNPTYNQTNFDIQLYSSLSAGPRASKR
ncbi:MAG: hypothetical protein N3E51_01265 [Candidatus Micrarchaeota archaeon]|nr:hypothetical protein [Candidatus Micrarchaeota archaeon]